MKLKPKFKPIFVLIAIGLLAGLTYFYINGTSAEKNVKIIDYGHSTCTPDIPSSYCGSYDVIVINVDGQKTTYRVAGFDNRESKLYDEVTAKIAQAKEYKTQVTIKINNNKEIIAVK